MKKRLLGCCTFSMVKMGILLYTHYRQVSWISQQAGLTTDSARNVIICIFSSVPLWGGVSGV